MRDLSPKAKRGIALLMVVSALGLAVMLVLTALRDHVVFFYGPSDIRDQASQGQIVRLGGLVAENSVTTLADGIGFTITDGTSSMNVVYAGVLPDLFREGQGVVTEGVLDADIFRANSVLAKHDETYMPAEVADMLKDQGVWKGQE
ncbi:MAG TPA: cytochrome c maturation protein CcmE [Alphaproteobacteria bacterium]|nr:cytochrome c maturation protein CcmE [Alphaproteobacteria bacterium]